MHVDKHQEKDQRITGFEESLVGRQEVRVIYINPTNMSLDELIMFEVPKDDSSTSND